MPAQGKINFEKMRSFFFFGLIIFFGVTFLYLIQPFLYPIFWAAILTVVFYPFYTSVHKHIRMPGLSSFVSVLFVFLVTIIPLALVSLLLVNESIHLYQSVNHGELFSKVEHVTGWLETTRLQPVVENIRNEWTASAGNITKEVSVFLFSQIKNVTQNSFRFVFMLFLMIYTMYYFFKDGQRMLKKLTHLSPLGDTYEALLYKRFTSTVKATLKGTFIVGGIQGTLGGILFWAAGIEGALVWGVIMFLLALIPGIGTSVVWLPTGIIMLALGNVWQGVLILLFGAFVISLIDNILRPRLIGKDTQMHPLIVLFATLGGILFFGISGFVMGPVIAALFLSVISMYDVYYKNELAHN